MPLNFPNNLNNIQKWYSEDQYHILCLEKTIEFYKEKTTTLVEQLKNEQTKNKQLIEKSFLDSLTWLYNQAFLNKQIKENNNTFNVISLDIKEFKEINDQLWQDEWNRILNDVWKILSKETKNIDSYAIRNWGDEFILLLHKDQDKRDLLRKINKWLKSIEWEDLKVKFSIWIAESNETKTLKDLVIIANNKAWMNKTKNGKLYRIFKFIESLEDNIIKKIIKVLEWILKQKILKQKEVDL